MATFLHITYAIMDSYDNRWISPRWPGGFCRNREKAKFQRGCERAFYFTSRCQSLDCKFGKAVGVAVVRAHDKTSGTQDAVTKTLDDKGAARGILRVTVDTVFLSVISPIALGLFLAENPELTLDLITKDRRSDLRSESVDLDIRFGAVPRGSFIRRKLGETRVLTVAAPRYIERFGRLRSPTDMFAKNHVIIDFCDPITARPFEWTFRNKKKEEVAIPTDGRIIVNDIANMHGLCLAGFGIAQVLEVAVRDQLRDGRLVALFPDWQEEVFPLIAIYPSRQHTPLKTKTFLNFVVNEVKKAL
jgi:DNA-binding transcriptional LysR family regulator